MSKLDLSSDARHRLWKCYALLISLAGEAEENTAAQSELCEGQESATTTQTTELIRSENDTLEREPEQIEK